jgi:ubiquinone/menaquinone biosynthesis C-methylase UbiE
MYLLNDKIEHLRLDKQNSMEVYSVKEELKDIDFNSEDMIMDAGCGHGAITDELLRKGVTKIVGVDGSKERIKNYSKKYQSLKTIKSEVSKLEDLPFENDTFDKVICRFVLHHVTRPELIIKEYKRVLKKGGQLILVDSDGILFNIYSREYDFEEEFSILKKELPMDMMIGRKLKPYLNEFSFSNLSSKLIPMHFTGEQLINERDQYISRFSSMTSTLDDILGVKRSKEFVQKYVDSLNDSSTELFYNKFIVTGVK